MEQLKILVEDGFNSALGQRGISASIAFTMVKEHLVSMGDTDFEGFEDYAQYGLPLFKRVALK